MNILRIALCFLVLFIWGAGESSLAHADTEFYTIEVVSAVGCKNPTQVENWITEMRAGGQLQPNTLIESRIPEGCFILKSKTGKGISVLLREIKSFGQGVEIYEMIIPTGGTSYRRFYTFDVIGQRI